MTFRIDENLGLWITLNGREWGPLTLELDILAERVVYRFAGVPVGTFEDDGYPDVRALIDDDAAYYSLSLVGLQVAMVVRRGVPMREAMRSAMLAECKRMADIDKLRGVRQ